jgi:hypothetical protein
MNGSFFLWPNSPGRAYAVLLLEIARSRTNIYTNTTHTHTHTHFVGLLQTSEQLVAEAAPYATHKQRKRRTSMLSAGFELAIPENELL